MKPASFDYFAPANLDEALGLLAGHDGEAAVLAGGQSLVPAMNFRLATPAALVDINRIAGHDGVRAERSELTIDMLARHADVERCPVDDPLARLLARTARLVGHLPIRVRGTFAGSLAHADPAAEWCLLAVALDATVVATSTRGERHIRAGEFFEGPFTTALAPDEIITQVRLPLLGRAGAGMCEKSHTAGDFATVAAVATLRLDGDEVAEARLAVGGAEGRPVRVHEAEAALRDAPPEPAAFDAAARTVREVIDPVSDANCSGDYRRHLAEVLARRALEEAAQEALA